ncbi:Protein-lysine N-methyltransferase efm4 [Neolecta irregularis DAH-3]|uniref:Protein-lysine N-methyltransferase efm4 n=1 Tax=Neolecta irregularis (strain DAH-3) TaxID=1198029 RepID=A0A1U7LGW3_NEOID|nr:Protein-lysine N-methyltransferase efm4 [Neolecta irregularis DAH-3]|eukprot:OLL21896.1 Protein-lysine N-methyltransferase efm4 [Neolecta irregularis DAH-3]
MKDSEELSILDVGTGNGHLLLAIYDNGYTKCRLIGTDISPVSIELSQAIAKARGISSVIFRQQDLIKEAGNEQYRLVLDKGTFDAISLTDELRDGRRLNKIYAANIHNILSDDGIFLITSCNWTKKELIARFGDFGLEYHSEIKYPTYEFGGQKGQTITSVAFVKGKKNMI